MRITDDIFTFLLVAMITVILSMVLINIIFQYLPLVIAFALLSQYFS